MKSYLNLVFIFLFFPSCHNRYGYHDYEVSNVDSANFSILCSDLQPNEKLIVSLNDTIILSRTWRRIADSRTFWNHYRFPDKIHLIKVLDLFAGKIREIRLFKDTLTYEPQVSVLISRPAPRRMSKNNSRVHGFVSMDTGRRFIFLVSDTAYFKGIWRDNIH